MPSVIFGLGRGIIKPKTFIFKPIVVTPKHRSMAETSGSKEPNSSHRSTLNQEEVDKFRQMGDWWDPKGPAQGLLSMNRLRVPFIKDGLTKSKILFKLLGLKIGNFIKIKTDFKSDVSFKN